MFEINRSIEEGIEILELVSDSLSVKILPQLGNLMYSLQFHKEEFLWFPFESVTDYRNHPRLCGIPLLVPWANRLDENGFDFEGTHYSLNNSIDFSKDSNGLPIHGLVAYSDRWERKSETITNEFVEVTSRLRFWKYADYMTHFPFAHNIILTHRVTPNQIEFHLEIINKGEQNMPVMIGFHPYFQIPNLERNKWKFSIPATHQLILNNQNLPTGSKISNDYQELTKLEDLELDHVFDGHTPKPFVLQGGNVELNLHFISGYSTSVVYAPLSRDVMCFEPMTAQTNAISQYHRDKSVNLPIVQPNTSWIGKFIISIKEI